MNDSKINAFLQNVNEDTILQYTDKQQFMKIFLKFACLGCGKGKQCNFSEDEDEVQCDACMECDCLECDTDFKEGRAYDWQQPSYFQRIKILKKMLKTFILSSSLNIDLWANILPTHFLMEVFKYTNYKDLWRKHVFTSTEVPINYSKFNIVYDEIDVNDKQYFLTPSQNLQKLYETAYFYKIARIIAGIPSLNYSD